MAEPEKQQIGDGSDHYGQAISQAAKAAKQAGQEAAKNAVANAAAATVQASVEGGKAAAEIATGTAAGGPLGAILSTAWALRHTLLKVLVCICLGLTFLIVTVVSLPAIIFDYIFGTSGTPPDPTVSWQDVYAQMAEAVSGVVDSGYAYALGEVDRIIADGGYDYNASMDALINYAQSSAGYDVSYILAAYSASMEQQNTSKEDMIAKLDGVAESIFPVTSEAKTKEVTLPVTYYSYEPVALTVVTSQTLLGVVNDVPQYEYTLAEMTYYVRGEEHTSTTAVQVDAYTEVAVTLPLYSGGRVTGTKTESYYTPSGTQTLSPEMGTLSYVECTIHPFDNAVINRAFGVDPDAQYGQFNTTYGEAIQSMANSLKMTLYGSMGAGQAVPLNDAELLAFVARQNCTPVREALLKTGLSLVGKVPYFWGGKSGPGWNEEWNTPKLVTAAGSQTSGTIRPFGLDCSGFTDWVYKTALDYSLYEASGDQWSSSYAITAEELQPGDLGFLTDGSGGWTHVLMFAGYGESGERMWVHSSGGEGVILNSPSYESGLALRRPLGVNFDALILEDAVSR